MTPDLSPRTASPVRARSDAAPVRSPRAVGRRRRALLQLARRHGEVRLRIGPASGLASHVICDLLDELNGEGLLRYGGLHQGELLYRPA